VALGCGIVVRRRATGLRSAGRRGAEGTRNSLLLRRRPADRSLGKYLAEELPAIYGEQAAAVVVFVSAEYAARDWTRLERRAALNRAVRERREYVLPARFDDTPLPGLLSDMVAVDLQTRTPQQFAAMIADKLARLPSARSADVGDRARDVESAPLAGAVRAGDVNPRRLGVRAAGGRLQQAVSVRFTEEELHRIQAYAVVFGISPNAVIREACEHFLTHKVGTKEYEEALKAYRRRSEEQVATLEKMMDAS
jgi:hypothetical protein